MMSSFAVRCDIPGCGTFTLTGEPGYPPIFRAGALALGVSSATSTRWPTEVDEPSETGGEHVELPTLPHQELMGNQRGDVRSSYRIRHPRPAFPRSRTRL